MSGEGKMELLDALSTAAAEASLKPHAGGQHNPSVLLRAALEQLFVAQVDPRIYRTKSDREAEIKRRAIGFMEELSQKDPELYLLWRQSVTKKIAALTTESQIGIS